MPGPVIYIMGVAGSGKTTIGKMLADRLSIPFFDADDYHSSSNKEKMRNGIALTDEDRADWLASVNAIAIANSRIDGAIIACSALKEKYRAVLEREIATTVTWIWLQGDFELIQGRMQARQGHYMPPSLLRSQFEILEPPANATIISIEKKPLEIIDLITTSLKNKRDNSE